MNEASEVGTTGRILQAALLGCAVSLLGQSATAKQQPPIDDLVTSIEALQLSQHSEGVKHKSIDITAQLTYAEDRTTVFFVQQGRRATMIRTDEATTAIISKQQVGTILRIVGYVNPDDPFVHATEVYPINTASIEPINIGVLDEDQSVPVNGLAVFTGRVREAACRKNRTFLHLEQPRLTVTVAISDSLSLDGFSELFNKSLTANGCLLRPASNYSSADLRLMAMSKHQVQAQSLEESKWPRFKPSDHEYLEGEVLFSNNYDRIVVRTNYGDAYILTRSASIIRIGDFVQSICTKEPNTGLKAALYSEISVREDWIAESVTHPSYLTTITGTLLEQTVYPLITYYTLATTEGKRLVLTYHSTEELHRQPDLRIGDEIQVKGHHFRNIPYAFDPVVGESNMQGVFLENPESMVILQRPVPLPRKWLIIAVVAVMASSFIAITYTSTLKKLVSNRTAELSELNKNLNVALNSLTKSLLLFDRNHKLSCINNLAANLHAEIMTNASESEAIKQITLQFGSPDLGNLYAKRLKSEDFETTERVDVANGVLEVHTAPVRNKSGQISGRVWTIENITLKVRMEKGLLDSQKSDLLGKLAGSYAHDYGNLLGVIQASCRAVQKLENEHPKIKPALTNLDRALNKAISINNKLMAFARRSELEIELCDVRDVVSSAIQLYRSALSSDAEILLDLDDQTLPSMVDQSRLEQAIINILANAGDAIKEGVKGIIMVSAKKVDHSEGNYLIRIDVSDNGIGMDDRTRAHAAEAFFTTKQRGKGTGLGLSSAKNLIEQLGGELEIQSTLGAGSKISMILPYNTGIENQNPNIDSVKVAVIESRAHVADDLLTMVNLSGITGKQITVSELMEAVEEKQYPWDCLIVGIEAIEGVTENLTQAIQTISIDKPVLLYSYGRLQQSVVSALLTGEAGRVRLLGAPFKPNELLVALRAVMLSTPAWSEVT